MGGGGGGEEAGELGPVRSAAGGVGTPPPSSRDELSCAGGVPSSVRPLLLQHGDIVERLQWWRAETLCSRASRDSETCRTRTLSCRLTCGVHLSTVCVVPVGRGLKQNKHDLNRERESRPRTRDCFFRRYAVRGSSPRSRSRDVIPSPRFSFSAGARCALGALSS